MFALTWVALNQVSELVFVHVGVVELSLVLIVVGFDFLSDRI